MTLKSFGIDDEKEFSYELQLIAKFENARVVSDSFIILNRCQSSLLFSPLKRRKGTSLLSPKLKNNAI